MTRGSYERPVLLVAAALALTACGTAATAQPVPAASPSGHGLLKVHDPRHVTGTLYGHCAYRDHGLLPDPRCTPGSVDPAVTQGNIRSTICWYGYTRTVRPPEAQTERFKFDAEYAGYATSGRTELDHLVPLELGGSNDATNLWPEPGASPNPKDSTERALNRAVCEGRIPLAAAQNAIASNWTTALARLGL